MSSGGYANLAPTKRLYFSTGDFIEVIQLDNGGRFVGVMRSGNAKQSVSGTWEGELRVRRIGTEGAGYDLGDFQPTGLSDNGIVVGRKVMARPSPGQGGSILFAPAWFDAKIAEPLSHVVAGGGASSWWSAVSRNGEHAIGGMTGIVGATCTNPQGGTEQSTLLGAPTSAVPGPELDARAIPCTRAGTEVPMPLKNELRGVNDLGEAVGNAEAREPKWYCRIDYRYPSCSYDFDGVKSHPVYVSPGGGITDLMAPLSFLRNPSVAGINRLGQVAGSGATGSYGTSRIAFRYDLRTGSWSLLPWPATTSGAMAIDEHGNVLVKALNCYWWSCSWTDLVWTPDDQVYDLGYDLYSASLNDQGKIVGSTCGSNSCWIGEWELPNQPKLKVIASAAGSGPPVEVSSFAMSPSVLSSGAAPYGAGPQRLPFRLTCLKPNGDVAPSCDIKLRWNAQAGSGGHVHDTNRPPGAIATEHGVNAGTTGPGPAPNLSDSTGSSGILAVTYTAPEASGLTTFVATGSAVVDGVRLTSEPAPFTIRVRHEGLVAITAAGVQVATASTMHGMNNGNGTPELGASLANAADLFAVNLTTSGLPASQVPAVRVTAISLPEGGLFDFSAEWSPPHRTHRFGSEADVGMALLTPDHKKALADAIKGANLATPVWAESPSNPSANHWHVVR